MERRFHEFDEQLGDGERALLFLEQVGQALPSVLDRRGVAVSSQLLLDFLGAALLLGDVQFEELDVVWKRGGGLALGAEVVEAQRGLNGGVYQVLRLQPSSAVEQVPLVLIVRHAPRGRVEQRMLVDQAEEEQERVEGVLSLVAQ